MSWYLVLHIVIALFIITYVLPMVFVLVFGGIAVLMEKIDDMRKSLKAK